MASSRVLCPVLRLCVSPVPPALRFFRRGDGQAERVVCCRGWEQRWAFIFGRRFVDKPLFFFFFFPIGSMRRCGYKPIPVRRRWTGLRVSEERAVNDPTSAGHVACTLRFTIVRRVACEECEAGSGRAASRSAFFFSFFDSPPSESFRALSVSCVKKKTHKDSMSGSGCEGRPTCRGTWLYNRARSRCNSVVFCFRWLPFSGDTFLFIGADDARGTVVSQFAYYFEGSLSFLFR